MSTVLLLQDIKIMLQKIKDRYPYAYMPFEFADDTLRILGTEIKIYVAEKLSEAWIEAYPTYQSVFQEDQEFLEHVNYSNGKWLEPKNNSTHLCILLTDQESTKIKYTLIHELRHCFDFIKTWNAWKETGHDGIPPNSQEYSNWSEFNAVYTETVLRLFDIKTDDAFEALSSFLGYKGADCVAGILRNSSDADYYISRYIGLHRAIRDLSTVICPAPVFHLWHMIPQAIDKIDSEAFYKANHYQGMDYFSL